MMSVPYTAPAPRPAAAGSASTVSGTSAFGSGFVPQTPSHWVHDSARSACSSCHAQFSFFSRRHHCRVCREVFCDSCSDYRLLTRDPKDRTSIVSVRACRPCFDKHKGSKTKGTPKGAKPRARPAAQAAGSQTRAAATAPDAGAAVPPTAVTTQSVTVGAPVFNLTTPGKSDTRQGGFYVQRQSSDAQLRSGAAQEDAVEVQASADDGEQDEEEADGDEDSVLDMDNFTGQIFEEDEEEEDEAGDAFPAPTVDVSLNSSLAPSAGGAELYKETARILPTPPHAKTVELEVMDGAKSAMTAGSRPSMEGKGGEERGVLAVESEKDEFEREGDDREAQQQILNIPADALASVRHSSGQQQQQQQQSQHRPAPVLHSEEAAVYSERNVEKRFIVPPSPVTGVADLLQLASPSATPQPLLNALNDSRTKPEDVAKLAQKAADGVSVSAPVFPTATAAASTSILSPRRTNSLLAKAAHREPPGPPALAAVSPSPAEVQISRFVPVGSSTASFSTRTEGQPSVSSEHQQEEHQPGLSTSASSSQHNPTVSVPAWPQTSAASTAAAAKARTPRVSASTVDPPAALYDSMDAVVEGADAISAAPRPEARQRRLVLKKRRVQRTPTAEAFSKLMRPLPLLGLALLLLVFLAIFPLPVTIIGTLLLASAPVLYSFLYSKRDSTSGSRPNLTVSAPQQPSVSAASQALSDWERAEQRMDGLAAMPSPSLTTHYASQTETEETQVVREKATDRETATASVPKQMAPRPKVVI